MSTKLLTVAEVAERLSLHPEMIRRLIRKGALPAIKIKMMGQLSAPKIREDVLEEWLEVNAIPAVVRKKHRNDLINFTNKRKGIEHELTANG